MTDPARIAALADRLRNYAIDLLQPHGAHVGDLRDDLNTAADELARLSLLPGPQAQGWQPIIERLNALADETDREAAAYAETFAPSRRLKGRAEGFRQAANLVKEMTNGTSIR